MKQLNFCQVELTLELANGQIIPKEKRPNIGPPVTPVTTTTACLTKETETCRSIYLKKFKKGS